MTNPSSVYFHDLGQCMPCEGAIKSSNSGSLDITHLKSALNTFFLDLAKYLHETDKFIHNTHLESQKEPKSAQSAQFNEAIAKNVPRISLFDISGSSYFLHLVESKQTTPQQQTDFLAHMIEAISPNNNKINENKDSFLVKSELLKFLFQCSSLFNKHNENYSSQIEKFDGNSEDFLASSAREIIDLFPFPETIKEKIYDFYTENPFRWIEHNFLALNVVDLSECCSLDEDFDAEHFLFYDLKMDPSSKDFLQLFTEKFGQPLIQLAALSASVWENKLKETIPISKIFSKPACESSFSEDVRELKDYFISKMKKERKLEQNFTLKLKKDNAYQSYIHSSQYIKVLDLFENDSPAFRLYLIQRESERLANQPNFKNNTQNVKQEFDNLIDDYVESYKKLKIGSSEPSDGLFEKLQNLILIVASRCNCNHLFQLQMVDLFTESENGLLNLLYFDEHRNNGGYIDQELSDDALKLESIYKKIARHSVIMDHLNTHHEQAQPEVADASSKQDNSSFFGNWSIFS